MSDLFYIIETEKCGDNTCQNGGSCTDTATGVDCTCPSNYGGDRCDKGKIKCRNSQIRIGITYLNTNSRHSLETTTNIMNIICVILTMIPEVYCYLNCGVIAFSGDPLFI